METSQCSSCGLTRQPCQCRREVSTTGSCNPKREAVEITPAYCCSSYLFSTLLFFAIPLFFFGLDTLVRSKESCYMELFTDSVSVLNANATADWRIRFVARSPVTGCKISLHTMRSRLLQGNEVISNSSSWPSEYFGQFDIGDDQTNQLVMTTVDFKTVATPLEVIGDVVWDFRVEIVAVVNTDDKYHRGDGFLMVFCSGLPVKFMADPSDNVMGSLLGNKRGCDYSFRKNLDS